MVRWIAIGVPEAVKGVPSIEGAQGAAAARRRAVGDESATRDCLDRGERHLIVNRFATGMSAGDRTSQGK